MLPILVALALTPPFSIDLPEGNHRVTVVLGDDSEAAETSLSAEVRRLYLDKVRTSPGQSLTRTFVVNVRRPEISGTSESVRLKDREKSTEAENWDGKLTLRWTGKVRSVNVDPAPEVPTLFLAGDSTVADQAGEAYGSWGQFLPMYFGPGIAVASHAESGESARSFFGERRWPKLLSVAKPGDYVLIQFGHNDQKAATVANFKSDLTRMITEAKAKGITPILVTSMHRRQFDESGHLVNTLGEFPDATRQAAREQSVALIDLNALSAPIYEKYGPEKSAPLFASNDTTHHSPEGARLLARAVADAIRTTSEAKLAQYLKPRVILMGDSTVRNGQGNGSNGQWGWGEPLGDLIGDRYVVINKALGGRSTKTYMTGGQWAEARSMLLPGDTVLIQFGHNDASPVNDNSRARGTLAGIGDETQEIDNQLTGKHETVHTFGWYLRQFIAGIREKGATPVLVTPIPGNSFKDGKPTRRPHSEWTRQVAVRERVPLIDLEGLIGRRYEQMGEPAVQALFHGDHTHTSRIGAELNASFVAQALTKPQPPKSWIDPDTGHRVVRLTNEPNSASLYFNQNGYTPNGKRLVYTTPDGISALDLATRTTKQVVKGKVRLIDAGRKNERVYYIKDNAVWYTDIDTLESKRVAALPGRGSVATINADETLIAGTYVESEKQVPYTPGSPQTQGHSLEQPRNKGEMMEQRWAARLPMGLFTMNLKTGEIKTIHRANDWLNHLLFSPTDPNLLMFCHEGPWHKVDRIWTIRTDGTQLTKIHTRTMAMEIFGHEFWGADGKTIWYDLQTPRGQDFWVAGYNLETKRRTWYHLQRNEWSIHFNITRDGRLFCGDGGDPGQVAKAPDGQWIYHFLPELIENRGLDNPDLVQPGVLRSEKLVNMSKHNYRLEPNVSFTPDQKWVVFRSNMLGDTYVFAAEVDKPEKN